MNAGNYAVTLTQVLGPHLCADAHCERKPVQLCGWLAPCRELVGPDHVCVVTGSVGYKEDGIRTSRLHVVAA